MNIERTIETRAVVTPNCAIESRNQTSSYKMLQKPEMKKKTKNQVKENFLRAANIQTYEVELHSKWRKREFHNGAEIVNRV